MFASHVSAVWTWSPYGERKRPLEDRGEPIVFWWPNTNTNIIWLPKSDQYEYEYHLVSEKWPNTNIIWLPKNDWIQLRISFSFQKWLNTNKNIIWFPKKIKYEIPKGGNKQWRKEISMLTVSMLHSIVVDDMQLQVVCFEDGKIQT